MTYNIRHKTPLPNYSLRGILFRRGQKKIALMSHKKRLALSLIELMNNDKFRSEQRCVYRIFSEMGQIILEMGMIGDLQRALCRYSFSSRSFRAHLAGF